MANTKLFFIYLFFLIVFNTFTGMFIVENNSDEEFNVKNYLVVAKYRDKLEQGQDFFTSLARFVLVPFMLLDLLIFPFIMITISITNVPTIVNALMFIPMGIMILFDYVLPMTRGN